VTRIIALAGMVFVLAVTVISAAYAGGSEIEARHSWSRPTIAGRPGVVYVTLNNQTARPALLTAIHTPVAGAAELHTSSMTDGVMRMRRVETLDIPAGGEVALTPGGYHIMLFDLDKPLKLGEEFPVTLVFRDAAPLEINVQVRKNGKFGDDQN